MSRNNHAKNLTTVQRFANSLFACSTIVITNDMVVTLTQCGRGTHALLCVCAANDQSAFEERVSRFTYRHVFLQNYLTLSSATFTKLYYLFQTGATRSQLERNQCFLSEKRFRISPFTFISFRALIKRIFFDRNTTSMYCVLHLSCEIFSPFPILRFFES